MKKNRHFKTAQSGTVCTHPVLENENTKHRNVRGGLNQQGAGRTNFRRELRWRKENQQSIICLTEPHNPLVDNRRKKKASEPTNKQNDHNPISQ